MEQQGHLTKKALSQALKELMKKTALDKIRVNQVTDLSGLSRNTFYYHFSDINELLAWTYDNEIVFGLESYREVTNWQEGLLSVLNYTELNRSFCLNTFHSLSRERLEAFLYRINYEMLLVIITKEKHCEGLSEKTQQEFADFYSRAIVAQLIQWLVTNLREPKQELVARVDRMTVGAIDRVVNLAREE